MKDDRCKMVFSEFANWPDKKVKLWQYGKGQLEFMKGGIIDEQWLPKLRYGWGDLWLDATYVVLGSVLLTGAWVLFFEVVLS